ncbi:pyrroline-5-carboxylate reductase [Pelotomaculum propionicicum]|uniref:pyrroline-5-carboxylate reductase n=1 Tax=Pelotomaculum propionicicum TaxID=258475 RepID=UPI003B827062
MPLKGQKIGFLGGGAMGEALITGLLRTGLVAPSEVYISDVDAQRLEVLRQKLSVNTTADNRAVVSAADIVIIAVKPHVAASVLKEIAALARPEKTFISIAAGVTISQIESCLEGPVPVIRVMPNTPCLVGEGASAVSAGKHAGEKSMKEALAIFNSAGAAVEVPESLLDCVTGLSGSGPAYMYVVLESLIDGAVRLGLPGDIARKLAAQTMLGAAKMVLETTDHPAKLKNMVTTPGGTTAAGLFALEEGALRSVLMKAVADATRRSREMSG